MGVSLRPQRLKHASLWLRDKAYFADLVKALNDFEDLDLVVEVARLPPDARGEVHVTGWVPASKVHQLTSTVEKVTEGHTEISFSDPELGKEVPSLIRHNRFLRPFQKLVESFGTPSYGEIDPTLFAAFSFMLVFGFMFADVGHGLILAAFGVVAYIMGGKTTERRGIFGYVLESGGLLMVCGLSGVLGGVLLGEMFGYHVSFLPSKIVLPKPVRIVLPFSPLKDPMPMFRLSLLVGTLDISFGLVLNICNKLLDRKLRSAFFEGFCWLWFYVGLMYSVFSYGVNLMALTGDPIMLWGILMPLSLMLIGKLSLEGLDGLMHFVEQMISTVSNTVSYLRILALSLAHSIISSLVLEVGGHNLLVAIIGSLPAIALEGLIVFIHSTRLMWVEWFSKFYHGKGTPFKAKVLFDWEIYGLESPYLEAIQTVGVRHPA
jgi:V/A-type H+-transporting ATPase subunit I